MKITKQCPECGGREIYTTDGFIDTQTRGLLPNAGSSGTFKTISSAEIYVCAGCGYYRMFLKPESIEKVKENYKPCG